MSGRAIWGWVGAAIVVLVTVFLYNRFSGKSIATLGAKTAA